MKGALVARLVEGCLSLLNEGGGRGPGATTTGRNGNDAATLHLEALRTLRALMDGVPLPRLWRSMLPGCFAGLYRHASSRLSCPSSGFSFSHNAATASSVVSIALLLEMTLGVDEYDDDGDRRRRPPATTTTAAAAAADDDVAASLMAAVAAHRRQLPLTGSHLPNNADDAARSANDPPRTAPIKEEEEEEKGMEEERKMREMKTEVNTRLVGPISVLLGMIPNAAAANGRHRRSGIELRKSGMDLCRSIMSRDVRCFWTESNRRMLERKSLEYCFATLGGDGDGVEDAASARCAREIVNSYKSYYLDGDGTVTSGRWRAHLSSTIVPTILELTEALPAFAKSGREMHVRHHLQLIDGYLMLSLRGNGDDDYFNLRKMKGKKSDIGSALSCAEAVDTVKRSFAGEKRRLSAWQWMRLNFSLPVFVFIQSERITHICIFHFLFDKYSLPQILIPLLAVQLSN
jgi:hypothetical protein